MSIYKKMSSDLSIILVWMTFTLIVLISGNDMLRTLFSMPTILFIPGYLLVTALFPKKDDLYNIERMTLSFVLSIVIIPLLGLLLNFTLGIRLIPMVVILYIWNIIMILITIHRRGKLSEDERFSVSFHKIYHNIIEGFNTKTKKDSVLTIVMIFAIVIFIGMAYLAITTPKIGERFTEFYILNSSEKTDNYMTNLKVDNSYSYLVGIINNEYKPTNYTIKVVLDKDVLTSNTTMLNHGDSWKNNMAFTPNKKGKDMMLEFWLFKDNNFTEPYRKLYMWVEVDNK